MAETLDAVVVGAGPNGLAAAIELARAGFHVRVYESMSKPGGGTQTRELTLPGFHHDVCSAVHPMGILSPFFRQLPLGEHGLAWLQTDASIGHPLEGRPAVVVSQDLHRTAESLGRDRERYMRLVAPFLEQPHALLADLLGPLNRWPSRPVQCARFGLSGLWPARQFAEWHFREPTTRALFAGCAGHSILSLEHLGTAAMGLIFLIAAHVENWPVARGGSHAIGQALSSYLKSLGGEIVCGQTISTLADLPQSRAVLFDLSPKSVVSIASTALPNRYCNRLRRYVYGPGTFKVDWALDGPIPWRDSSLTTATTVHVGGTLAEIANSERNAWKGRPCQTPFLILCQQSQADPSRAPDGKQTGYAYCHVPHGSTQDMTGLIETQIERFAPGFRDQIVARHTTSPTDLETYNPNYVGGAITGGAAILSQLLFRPTMRFDPYTTPNPRLFLCSASTPPGGGVHGMCGYHSARSVINRLRNGRI